MLEIVLLLMNHGVSEFLSLYCFFFILDHNTSHLSGHHEVIRETSFLERRFDSVFKRSEIIDKQNRGSAQNNISLKSKKMSAKHITSN